MRQPNSQAPEACKDQAPSLSRHIWDGEHDQRPPHHSTGAGAAVRLSRVRMIAEKVKRVNRFRFSGQTGVLWTLRASCYTGVPRCSRPFGPGAPRPGLLRYWPSPSKPFSVFTRDGLMAPCGRIWWASPICWTVLRRSTGSGALIASRWPTGSLVPRVSSRRSSQS
jgi:hypothetical protein